MLYRNLKILSYLRSILEETKEIQNLRRRPNGVNAVGLALGKVYAEEDEITTVGFL